MNRALVLVGCLAAAGAVAAYSKQSIDASDQPPVFTVPAPASPPAPAPAPAVRTAPDIPADRGTLVRELQRELRRVGCYGGDVNGVWTTSSRLAMKSFTDKVNASLPIDNPDDVLLSLVRGHKDAACATPCPPGEAPNDKGRCLVMAKAPVEALDKAPPPAQIEPNERSGPAAGPTAAAVAGAALVGSAALAPKPPSTSGAAESRPKMAAAPGDQDPSSTRSDRSPRASGSTPSERVYTRRQRRYSSGSRPPKFVRNVLRAFGFN